MKTALSVLLLISTLLFHSVLSSKIAKKLSQAEETTELTSKATYVYITNRLEGKTVSLQVS
jgi:hypothetical protein